MLIEKLISPVIPTLLPTDSGNRALHLMEENNVTHLPLVVDKEYTALVQEHVLIDWPTPESPLSMADFLDYKPAVIASGHPFDALRLAHTYNLDIVPVVDNMNIYIGAITRNNLLNYITENSGLDHPGGIIILEIAPRNYSLAEIARICENEDVTIISTQLYTDTDSDMLHVTLKTNRTDLSGVSRSFERYGYVIREIFGAELNEDHMLNRYKLLMNYLNM